MEIPLDCSTFGFDEVSVPDLTITILIQKGNIGPVGKVNQV